ncbi:MAG TPA: 2-C-methyl-D-erythritol 4-phosphate cytidylyltransferase [Streptosporangiaceae bacterium]
MNHSASPSRRTVAVIYAGDSDTQAEPGGPEPGEPGRPGTPGGADLLAPLAGRPIVEHSLAAFAAAPGVDEVMLIAGPALAGRTYHPAPEIVRDAGGRARSIARVLEVLTAIGPVDECDVLIHDADHPLIGPRVIADCLAALADSEAVCAAVPASDTMVAVEEGVITDRPPRDRLRYRQYPQGFRLPVIRRGYQLALTDPAYRQADDCAVVLRYLPAVPVRLVAGSEQGFRITSQADLGIAETLLGG